MCNFFSWSFIVYIYFLLLRNKSFQDFRRSEEEDLPSNPRESLTPFYRFNPSRILDSNKTMDDDIDPLFLTPIGLIRKVVPPARFTRVTPTSTAATTTITKSDRLKQSPVKGLRRSINNVVSKIIDSNSSNVIVKVIDQSGRPRIEIKLNTDCSESNKDLLNIGSNLEMFVLKNNSGDDAFHLGYNTEIKILPNDTVVVKNVDEHWYSKYDIYNTSSDVTEEPMVNDGTFYQLVENKTDLSKKQVLDETTMTKIVTVTQKQTFDDAPLTATRIKPNIDVEREHNTKRSITVDNVTLTNFTNSTKDFSNFSSNKTNITIIRQPRANVGDNVLSHITDVYLTVLEDSINISNVTAAIEKKIIMPTNPVNNTEILTTIEVRNTDEFKKDEHINDTIGTNNTEVTNNTEMIYNSVLVKKINEFNYTEKLNKTHSTYNTQRANDWKLGNHINVAMTTTLRINNADGIKFTKTFNDTAAINNSENFNNEDLINKNQNISNNREVSNTNMLEYTDEIKSTKIVKFSNPTNNTEIVNNTEEVVHLVKELKVISSTESIEDTKEIISTIQGINITEPKYDPEEVHQSEIYYKDAQDNETVPLRKIINSTELNKSMTTNIFETEKYTPAQISELQVLSNNKTILFTEKLTTAAAIENSLFSRIITSSEVYSDSTRSEYGNTSIKLKNNETNMSTAAINNVNLEDSTVITDVKETNHLVLLDNDVINRDFTIMQSRKADYGEKVNKTETLSLNNSTPEIN